MKLKKIGMRNIKTAFSVFICVALSQVFNREYIFYAAVAAVIGMQSSVSDSFKAGKNRMLGTIVGAFIGLICALIRPGNAVLCGIGIVIVIYICDLLDWKKSVPISCTVFLVIMLSLNGRPPVTYSINRTIDTVLGIAVAVLVNYFISPPKYRDKIYEERKLTIEKLFNIVENKLCYNREVDLKELNSEILKFEDLLNTYLSEARVKKQQKLKIDKMKEIISMCKIIHIHLRIIESLGEDFSLNQENIEKVKELFKYEDVRWMGSRDINQGNNSSDNQEETTDDYKEVNSNKKDDVNIVFNYHASKVIEGMVTLKNSI